MEKKRQNQREREEYGSNQMGKSQTEVQKERWWTHKEGERRGRQKRVVKKEGDTVKKEGKKE